MKRTLTQCLDDDVQYGEPSKNVSPINPSECYNPDMFLGYVDHIHRENHNLPPHPPRSSSSSQQQVLPNEEESFHPFLSNGIAASSPQYGYGNEYRDSLTIHLVDPTDPMKKVSLSLCLGQIENVCRESEFLGSLIQDFLVNSNIPMNTQMNSPLPMSPMRTASPAAASMRNAAVANPMTSPIRLPPSSPLCIGSPKATTAAPVAATSSSSSSSSTTTATIPTDGVVVFEEHLVEAIYLLGVMGDMSPGSDLSSLPSRFNLIWAKLCAKWKAIRFVNYFIRLMDHEISKILDIRTCDIIMISGDNECKFVPHKTQPDAFISKKPRKISTIQLKRPAKDPASDILYNWELTICIGKPDGSTALGKMSFPCKTETPLHKCSGVWDGNELKFRLGTRDERFTKAFISISELILSNELFQRGSIIKSKKDIINALIYHRELWTKEVFDALFTRDELTQFLLNHCMGVVSI